MVEDIEIKLSEKHIILWILEYEATKDKIQALYCKLLYVTVNDLHNHFFYR